MSMIIRAKVFPSSGRQEVIPGKVFKIYVKSPAEKGRANKEAEILLSRFLGKEARLISGKSSRKKVFEVCG